MAKKKKKKITHPANQTQHDENFRKMPAGADKQAGQGSK
jgi:hypothetical protein